MIKYFELIQKTNAFKIIENDYNKEKLSHCYLITSSDKDFLKEFVEAIKMLVVCENEEDKPCLNCNNCLRAKNGNYPDIISIGADKKINVEDINYFVENVYVPSTENDNKYYFLYNVSDININLQNKLLKTLEEPPKNVHIFLTNDIVDNILPTIISRVKVVNIEKLTKTQIYEYILEKYKDKKQAEAVASCCGGEIGTAEKLVQNEKLSETYDFAYKLLANLNSSTDVMVFSTNILQKNQDEIKYLFKLVENILEDILYIKNGNSFLNDTSRIKELSELEKKYSISAILEITKMIEECFKRTKVNCNMTIMIDYLLFSIVEVKHKCPR